MNEPLGIALELIARRKALAARLSPQARRLAFPDHYELTVRRRTIIQPTITVVGNDWSTEKRVTKYDKADRSKDQCRFVVDTCARIWQVPAGQIYDVTRKAIYVRPRQASMALMRGVLALSMPVIGVILHRDHTSCLHGLRKHSEIYEINPAYAAKYDQATAELRKVFKGNGATTSDTVAPVDDDADAVTEPVSRASSASIQQEAA
jgi:hypothetical protein